MQGQKHINSFINYGYNWHFKRYSSDQEYASVEEYAKKNKMGQRGLPNPVAP
jgi:hypothetical protein